jgi:hypothetical protein
MVSPWGFDPQQIAVLTHIWLGEDDGREMRPPPLRHYTGVITAAPTEENSGRTRWSPSPDALRLAAAFAVIVVLNAVLMVVWRQ